MKWLDLAAELLDAEVLFEAAAISIGFGLSSLFSHYYHSDKHLHDVVSDAKDINVSEGLFEAVSLNQSDFQNIAIVGNVIADGKENALVSRFNCNKTGVVSNFVIEEVKEIWGKYSHSWYESRRDMSNITESVPFSLTQNNVSVHIDSAEKSPWISQCFTDVNKVFRESQNSTMDSIMGLITGDRLKGYAETERMLLTGTRLLGIGELFVQNNTLLLRKPVDSELILTKQTKQELASALISKLRYWQILRIILLSVSLGGLYFFIKQLRKKYLTILGEWRYKDEVASLKKMRTKSGHGGNAQNNDGNEGMCVVCLTNPRECVVLNCGHVCLCLDCVENIPKPRKCPICRGVVDRVVPIFHA